MSTELKRTENSVHHTVRAKYIPDYDSGEWRLSTVEQTSRPVFLEKGWESADRGRRIKLEGDIPSSDPEAAALNRARSIRRASLTVLDYVLCNRFECFSTLTISPEVLNRTDYHEIEHAFSAWASNNVQRRGLKYIAVPEYHADGESIHLHMLHNDVLRMEDSGHMRKGKPVYNLSTWRAGFSTTQYITGENASDACAKYCLKYMTKQQGQKIGGRYYLSGGALITPRYEYADDLDRFDLDGIKWKKEVSQEWGEYKKWSFI